MKKESFVLLRRGKSKEDRTARVSSSALSEESGPEKFDVFSVEKYTFWYSARTILRIVIFSALNVLGFLYAISLTTWLPDVDQWLIGILHHRSIITHSVILPLIITPLISPKFRYLLAIIYFAIGVHLAADILSPSLGYGAIWLPEPFQFSIGVFSKPWIGANSIAAIVIAFRLSGRKYFNEITIAVLVSAFSYSVGNEERVLAFVVFLIFFTPIWLYFYSINKSRHLNSTDFLFVFKSYRQASKARAASKVLYRQSLGRFWRLKALVQILWVAFRAVLLAPVRAYKKPKQTFASLVVVVVFMAGAYAVGFRGSTTGVAAVASGAAEIAADGIWVLHSSGGYILQQGGRYVAGTLRATSP